VDGKVSRPVRLDDPAAALAHGIVVQALVDPGRFPPDRQRALVDQLIDRLRGDEPDKLDA